MKVRELIEALSGIDPEAEVLYTGEEGGFCIFDAVIFTRTFARNVNSDDNWWMGPHEDCANIYGDTQEVDPYPNHEKFQGIVIG